MCFNPDVAIYSLNGNPLRLVDQFKYLGSNISPTEIDVSILTDKAWTTPNMLMIISKSDLFGKRKYEFFQAVIMLVLVYSLITWIPMKC